MTWTASITPDDAAQEGSGLVATMLRQQHEERQAASRQRFRKAPAEPLWLAMARALAGPRLGPAEPEDYSPAVRALWAAVIEAVRDRIVPEEPKAVLPEYPEDWEVARWARSGQRARLHSLLTEEARIAREAGRD